MEDTTTRAHKITTASGTKTSGAKRALLIGINYVGTDNELNGCHNDVDSVAKRLHEYKITKLKDARGYSHPSRDTILDQMRQHVSATGAGDTLYVHYSGHGSQVRDQNGDEKDGMDETICAISEAGEIEEITDDELYATLVQPLHPEARLRVVLDCCHSGSGLDLPVRYTGGAFHKENKHTEKRNVVMISGCKDPQTSADARISGRYQGALTWALLETVAGGGKSRDYTWRELVDKIQKLLLGSDYDQIPQISFMSRSQADLQCDLYS